MPKFNHLFFVLAVCLFALSCKKNETTVNSLSSAEQVAPPNDTLQGKVFFYTNSSEVPNATVSIVGSTLQAITDQNGFYRFTNLGADTFDMAVLTPQGRRNQVQKVAHVAGAPTVLDVQTYNDDFYSYTTPTLSIYTFTNSAKALSIGFEFPFDGGGPYVMLVLSDSTGADPALVKTFDYSFDPYLGPYTNLYVNINDKKYYPSGTKVYVDVYLHCDRLSTYTDVYTNRLVYIGGGQSRTKNAFVIWP